MNHGRGAVQPLLGLLHAAQPAVGFLGLQPGPRGLGALALASALLAASERLSMYDAERSLPLAGVDEQRQMEQEARLACVRVAHLRRIRVRELAGRRVVDREHDASTPRALDGAKRMRLQ